MRAFLLDISKYKDFVHVNSSGFDFNVQTLARILVHHDLPCKSFDFVSTLRCFLACYNKLPKFTHSRLLKVEMGVDRLKLGFDIHSSDSDPGTLLFYICSDVEAYDMRLIRQQNGKRILYHLKKYAGDLENFESGTVFAFVLLPDSDAYSTSDKTLRFYVMVTDFDNLTPRLIQQQVIDPSAGEDQLATKRRQLGHSILVSPAKNVLEVPQETTFINEVQEIISALLLKARRFAERDVLWSKMSSTSPGVPALPWAEFQAMLGLLEKQHYAKRDPSLRELFALRVPWKNVKLAFQTRFKNSVRHVYAHDLTPEQAESAAEAVHLIILNENSFHVATHVWWEDDCLNCELLSCPKRDSGTPTAAADRARDADRHMSIVVNLISFAVWRQVVST